MSNLSDDMRQSETAGPLQPGGYKPYAPQAEGIFQVGSIGEVWATAWDIFKKNWVQILLIPWALISVVGVISAIPLVAVLRKVEDFVFDGLTFVIFIVLALISMFISVMMVTAIVRSYRQRSISAKEFFKFTGVLPCLLVTVLTSLATVLGLFLLIIPGVLAIFFFMFTVPAYIFDPRVGVFGSFKKSIRIVKNNLGSTALLLLIIIGVAILVEVVYLLVLATVPLALVVVVPLVAAWGVLTSILQVVFAGRALGVPRAGEEALTAGTPSFSDFAEAESWPPAYPPAEAGYSATDPSAPGSTQQGLTRYDEPESDVPENPFTSR